MMKKYARIDGGVVVEVFATGGDITQMFHPDVVWVPCGAEVAAGWSFDGRFFSAPPMQLAQAVQPTYAQLRALDYPPITDYLDGVVKGDQAQIDAYVAACLAVKAKYPKPID